MPEEALRELKTKVFWYKSTVAEMEKAKNALIRYQQDKEQAVSEADEAVLKGDLDAFVCVRERMSIIDMLISMAESSFGLFRTVAAKQILEIIESIDQI